MSKKRWFIVPVAAGLLALALTGGAIFAQGNDAEHGGQGRQGIITRVSEILDLDESTVKDAFSQAHQEQQEAGLQNKLDQLVVNEKLTQEEADSIWQWYQDKPDTNLPLRGFMHRGADRVQQFLDKLVEAERLTQTEADEVMEWYQDKPEALTELSDGHGRFDRGDRDKQGERGERGSHGRGFRHGPQPGNNETATDTRLFEGASRSFNPQINAQGVSY